MTTPSTARKAGPLLGNGSTTSFPFTFKVFAASDVAVSIADSAGAITVLVLDTDYSVSLNANQDTSPGGTITYPISGAALPTGSKLAITGDLDYDQPLDLPSGGNFSPLALENQLDRATMQIQQLKELSDRSAKMSVYSSAEDVEALTSGIIVLAEISDDIAAVAANEADILTVAANTADISTVAGSITAVNTVADNLSLWRDATAADDITVTNFSGTGAQVAFTLPYSPGVENNTQVYISGVYQQKDQYSVSGAVITFSSAPPSGTNNIEVVWSRPFVLGATDSALVSYLPAGTGAVPTLVQTKLREIVSVKDFGAKGDGTDDLANLETARDAAAALGATLFFPDGVYGISDRFMFADGGNAFFMPGASLKLLDATASGGAVSGPYPTQTKPIQVHNLTIDCNNFAGENGIGFGNVVDAKLVNLTVKNCLHSTSSLGGKALQFEGTQALNVQVLGFNAENCTVGIDIAAYTPSSVGQTVHISISNVSMKNVDIPVHVNDTYTVSPPDSYDVIEVLIDGLHCRNCGKLTYSGATSTDGAIFVSDRGFKLTARNVQVVNDRGTYGSTAYGGIGGLTRGSWKGLILEDVLFDADCTALFDFNISSFQSANVNQTGMYVLANNVRHYGNLDYVVKSPTGASRIGACRLEGIEIGSTAATLAGLLDAPAQTYTGALLEVIDRDNSYQSTGLRTFNRLAAMGNLLTSSGVLGLKVQAVASGSWTPSDGSGAGLSFTSVTGTWFRIGEMVIAYGTATYPVTASGVAAKIGGLPFTIENTGQNRATGIVTVTTKSTVTQLYPEQNATTAPFLTSAGAGATNADCSAGVFAFMFIYRAKS